jgi:hypothetical protein
VGHEEDRRNCGAWNFSWDTVEDSERVKENRKGGFNVWETGKNM